MIAQQRAEEFKAKMLDHGGIVGVESTNYGSRGSLTEMRTVEGVLWGRPFKVTFFEDGTELAHCS